MAEFLLRWVHLLAGITWIGLLYYFNFVQGPFFAEADASTKSAATQKLVPRALWWFRWAAMLTFLTGVLIVGKRLGESPLGAAAWSTPWAVTILSGGLLGTLMFLNVWLVIWPKQRVVIASAVAAAAGGAAHPTAAAGARRAFLASRTNVVLSVPMIFFMAAATHMPPTRVTNLAGYWAGTLLIAALLEINALAATTGPTTKPLEKVRSVIITGIVFGAVAFAMLRWCLTA